MKGEWNGMGERIDITYDLRNDSKSGNPDEDSMILYNYHKILWGKKLPNGNIFELKNNKDNIFLNYKNSDLEFNLSSDWIMNTYSHWDRLKDVVKQVSDEDLKTFNYYAHTIGGFIIFPKDTINGLSTINVERGRNPQICDRFDLTLECIRCHYNNENSPLKEVLGRYGYYFKMLKDFKGFCEYFFLQDLTFGNYTKVKFFLPFNGYEENPYPKTVDEYLIYMTNFIDFYKKRNIKLQE